jgi:hypothetical protein
LPDPFAPLDAIAQAGCVLEDLTDEDAVIAMAPAPLAGERFADLVVLHDRDGARPAVALRRD